MLQDLYYAKIIIKLCHIHLEPSQYLERLIVEGSQEGTAGPEELEVPGYLGGPVVPGGPGCPERSGEDRIDVQGEIFLKNQYTCRWK